MPSATRVLLSIGCSRRIMPDSSFWYMIVTTRSLQVMIGAGLQEAPRSQPAFDFKYEHDVLAKFSGSSSSGAMSAQSTLAQVPSSTLCKIDGCISIQSYWRLFSYMPQKCKDIHGMLATAESMSCGASQYCLQLRGKAVLP